MVTCSGVVADMGFFSLNGLFSGDRRFHAELPQVIVPPRKVALEQYVRIEDSTSSLGRRVLLVPGVLLRREVVVRVLLSVFVVRGPAPRRASPPVLLEGAPLLRLLGGPAPRRRPRPWRRRRCAATRARRASAWPSVDAPTASSAALNSSTFMRLAALSRRPRRRPGRRRRRLVARPRALRGDQPLDEHGFRPLRVLDARGLERRRAPRPSCAWPAAWRPPRRTRPARPRRRHCRRRARFFAATRRSTSAAGCPRCRRRPRPRRGAKLLRLHAFACRVASSSSKA